MSAPRHAPLPGPARGLGARWERYWFGPGSLVRLGAFRMILMAAAYYAAWHFRSGVLQHADGVDVDYLRRVWNPIYAFQVLGVDPPGPRLARGVYAVLVTAIALGFVGLFTRVSTLVAAVLSFYWIGTHYSFGKPHHDCVVLILALAALPLSPCGQRLSLDSLLARLRTARRGESLGRPEAAPVAALPLRLTQLSAALGYFFAGGSKLATSGLGWMNGYTLQGIMLEYRSDWSEELSAQVPLLAFLSLGLILVQFTFPVCLVWKRARWFYVPAATSFHLIAMKTMATGPFLTLWFTLAAFVPLEAAPAFLRRVVVRGPLWRRVLWGVLLLWAVGGTATLYVQHKSPWLLLPLLPLGAALLLRLRTAPPREIVYDPIRPRERIRAALLAGLDWGGRLALRPRRGQP